MSSTHPSIWPPFQTRPSSLRTILRVVFSNVFSLLGQMWSNTVFEIYYSLRSKRFQYEAVFRILAARKLEREQTINHSLLRWVFALAPICPRPAAKKVMRKRLLYRLILLLFNGVLPLMWGKILLFFQLVKRWQVTWRLRLRLQNNTTENKWHTGKKTITLFKQYWLYFCEGEGFGRKSHMQWFLAKFPCTYNVKSRRPTSVHEDDTNNFEDLRYQVSFAIVCQNHFGVGVRVIAI